MTLTKKEELLYAIGSFSQAISCASWATDIEKDIAEHLWSNFRYQLDEDTNLCPGYTLDEVKEYLSEINSLSEELQEYPWIDSLEQNELESFKPLKDVVQLAKDRNTINQIESVIEHFEEIENDIFKREIKRSGMSFYLTNSPIVMYGGAGKGKSYSPFFVKYNLMGMTNEQLKDELEKIIHNIDLPEHDRNGAKNILDNIND